MSTVRMVHLRANGIALLKMWLFILAASFYIGNAFASNDQFYFSGKYAALGASSAAGKGSTAVYLRWDVVEGNLPADVVRLQLERDGELLLDKNVLEVMSVADINQMYAGPAEQQRLLQTLTLLKKYALGDTSVDGSGVTDDFNASDFAIQLHNRFADNDAWTYFASRQNFNIARARYRAFLDTEVSGNANYRLFAVNAGGVRAQIGQIAILANELTQQLQPVSQFRQVANQSCSAADNMRYNNTVVLDWLAAGNNVIDPNISDRAANSLQLGGYQLYRSTENLAAEVISAPLIDLSAEAAGLPHDQRGNVQFPNLQKVNELLLVAEGSGVEPNRQPAFIDTPESLMAAGLKPGDKRAYYIVPVDYAGHLGETSRTIIQVPDRLRPATPWNINFNQSHANGSSASLDWDESTLINYAANFSFSRVICNSAEAAISGRVEYAYSIEACAQPVKTRLDISNYLVYRFEDSQQANGFVDADGDGYSDADERTNGTNACLAAPPYPNASVPNYLVSNGNFDVTALSEGRSTVRFQDTFITQPENVGKVFSYRVASTTSDGNISSLSAPLPAVFYDAEIPVVPTVTAIVRGNCCEITEIESADKSWRFDDIVNEANQISLVYKDNPASQSIFVNLSEFGNRDSSVCASDGTSPIVAFIGQKDSRRLTYGDVCTADVPNNMNICVENGWQLEKKPCDRPLEDNTIVDGGIIIFTIDVLEGECASMYETIAGQSSRVASSCGNGGGTLIYEAEAGFCGFTLAEDASGNQSAIQPVPCSLPASNARPHPPQPISLDAGQNEATFSWRLPLSPVAVTLIELSSDVDGAATDPTDLQLISVPHAGFNPALIILDRKTAIHALLDERDQWCIRLKAIAPQPAGSAQTLASDWSNKLCTVRRSNGIVSTTYIPWPKISALPLEGGLPEIISGADFVDNSEGLVYEKMPLILPLSDQPVVEDRSNCVFLSRPANYFENERERLFASGVQCDSLSTTHEIEQTLIKRVGLPFIAYRQARTSEGALGSWVQVSPLIDDVYWRRTTGKDADDKAIDFWKLNDPYFGFIRKNYVEPATWYFSYIDRYPYIAGYEYRYQFVSFTKEHAIRAVHQSGWKQTNRQLQSQAGVN